MLNGSSRNEIAYARMMAGAIAKIVSVGLIKMRMQRFGHATLGAVQKTPKNTTVHSAYRSVSRMRASFPAPKFVEMMGWDACPTLYAQHWTNVLTLMMGP